MYWGAIATPIYAGGGVADSLQLHVIALGHRHIRNMSQFSICSVWVCMFMVAMVGGLGMLLQAQAACNFDACGSRCVEGLPAEKSRLQNPKQLSFAEVVTLCVVLQRAALSSLVIPPHCTVQNSAEGSSPCIHFTIQVRRRVATPPAFRMF